MIHCLVCGVIKDQSGFDNCNDEMSAAGLNPGIAVERLAHTWIERKIGLRFYGRSAAEMMAAFQMMANELDGDTPRL